MLVQPFLGPSDRFLPYRLESSSLLWLGNRNMPMNLLWRILSQIQSA